MEFNGKKVTMDCFVFSNPVINREDLIEWKEWFSSKGVFSFIRNRNDGTFDLIREGTELPTDMPCEPIITNCNFCGNDPPHAFGWSRYCNGECCSNDYITKRRVI